MKKTLAFILFIILLFLVSCGETPPTLYGISGKNLFYELPSRIVFTDDNGVGIQNYYYSKADGTVGLGNKDKYGNLEFCLFEATIQEDGTWSPLTRVPYVFEE